MATKKKKIPEPIFWRTNLERLGWSVEFGTKNRAVRIMLSEQIARSVIDIEQARFKYGKDLTTVQREQIENLIRSFADMAYKKFAAGAKEHKNDLTPEVARKELIGEAIDTFIYAMVVNAGDNV